MLVRKHKGKSPLQRTECRQEDNIKMYLREMGCEWVDRTQLAQDRLKWWAVVNKMKNL
jgi:hypothetical protein